MSDCPWITRPWACQNEVTYEAMAAWAQGVDPNAAGAPSIHSASQASLYSASTDRTLQPQYQPQPQYAQPQYAQPQYQAQYQQPYYPSYVQSAPGAIEHASESHPYGRQYISADGGMYVLNTNVGGPFPRSSPSPEPADKGWTYMSSLSSYDRQRLQELDDIIEEFRGFAAQFRDFEERGKGEERNRWRREKRKAWEKMREWERQKEEIVRRAGGR